MPVSRIDVIEMLFGEGNEDVSAFASSKPLKHKPGTHYSYSSGDTNILSNIIARILLSKTTLPDTSENRQLVMRTFMQENLFKVLNYEVEPKPVFDNAGTWIGSSFCYCIARDFARIGLLYLRNGIWDGTRIVPDGWVDRARKSTSDHTNMPADDGPYNYGEHWWIWRDGDNDQLTKEESSYGIFSANGYGWYQALLLLICARQTF